MALAPVTASAGGQPAPAVADREGAMAEIRYLNTDLDLVAARDLTPLAEALSAQGVRPLYGVTHGEDERWYATFETDEQHATPEESMVAMLDAIESLPGPARTLWKKCSLREFNIGYDCGDHPWAFNNGLSNGTLIRAGAAGATLRITLYPPEKRGRDEPDDSADVPGE
jgi:hypothetical protein